MKPICVKCQRFYTIKKTGFAFIEGMPVGDLLKALPGRATPHRWIPYKLWMGDLWKCKGCGSETISGVSRSPIAEHYQSDFAAMVESFDATFKVNDC